MQNAHTRKTAYTFFLYFTTDLQRKPNRTVFQNRTELEKIHSAHPYEIYSVPAVWILMTGESIPGVECMGKVRSRVLALGFKVFLHNGKWPTPTLTLGNTMHFPVYIQVLRLGWPFVSKVFGPSLIMLTNASATLISSKYLLNWLAVGAWTTEAVFTTLIGDVGSTWAANNIDSLKLARVWSDMIAVKSGSNYKVLW